MLGREKMLIEEVCNDIQINVIVGLAREIWNEYFTAIIGNSQVDYMLEKFQSKKAITEQLEDGYLYFLIKANNEAIGYIGVLPKDKKLFLSKLYVRSAKRDKGYGREAIKFLEELAIKKGVNRISLTVNKNNSATIETYKKLGFEVRDHVIQDIGNGFVMDDYEMQKDLLPL